MLNDTIISQAIVKNFMEELLVFTEVDVAIAGAGPAGLEAAYFLAKEKVKVAIFERKLSVGGGMWGGGMMFNKIVIQEESKRILDELGIRVKEYKKGYYIADSVEVVTGLAFCALKAGAKIFNLVNVEDVMIREEKLAGFVLNWSAVDIAKLHVDPLGISCRVAVDATGHASEIARTIEKKKGPKLHTETGSVIGEKPMWAEVGEKTIVENTKEVYPNLYVAGMAANAVFGGPRMGPIFGGMLLSGEKVAKTILKTLHSSKA